MTMTIFIVSKPLIILYIEPNKYEIKLNKKTSKKMQMRLLTERKKSSMPRQKPT